MSFELPLTALAMEIAGTAARAVGACQTLTMPASPQADAEELILAAVDAGREAGRTESARVAHEAPPPVTVTF